MVYSRTCRPAMTSPLMVLPGLADRPTPSAWTRRSRRSPPTFSTIGIVGAMTSASPTPSPSQIPARRRLLGHSLRSTLPIPYLRRSVKTVASVMAESLQPPPPPPSSHNTAFDFYQDGTQVTSTATPNSAFPGFLFAGWSGSLTGTTNPDTVTIHDQFVPTASFNTIAAPLAISSFSPATASATASAMDFTINGTGFTTSTFLNWNSSPRSLTFVSSTQLTLHLLAGDLANPGGQAIFMGNNVVNSSSVTCGVDILSSFIVTSAVAPTLKSIAVTPANPSIAKGATQQFTATGTFSDRSTQNLTTSVTWSWGTTTTASISASGLANGAGVGSSTITATS